MTTLKITLAAAVIVAAASTMAVAREGSPGNGAHNENSSTAIYNDDPAMDSYQTYQGTTIFGTPLYAAPDQYNGYDRPARPLSRHDRLLLHRQSQYDDDQS